jgi:Ca-activated chloride channel family protein
MNKKPFDDETLRAALRQQPDKEPVNHDPAAMERAVGAALRVFNEEKQKETQKVQNSFRGFAAALRQLFHNNLGRDAPMNLRKTLTYAVPVLATVSVLGWVGLHFAESNPYAVQLKEPGPRQQIADAEKKSEGTPAAVPGIATAPSADQRVDEIASKSADKYAQDSTAMAQIAPASPRESAAEFRAISPSSSPAMAGNADAMMRAKVGSIAPGMPYPYPHYEMMPVPVDTAKFSNAAEQSIKITAQEPVSTFSLDVDTASYTFVRKNLSIGHLPPAEAVRVEEMINYFPYSYETPSSKEKPFAFTLAVYPAPWNSDTKLLHVGLKSYEMMQRPRANIVFLIDVSGSMRPENRLPLLKNALAGLVDELKPDDTISIVTYSGQSGVVLEPTAVKDEGKIKAALAGLGSGGGTAGAQGLRTAYALAEKSFDKKATNRVILATDGDFNIGINSPDELQSFIEQKRETGIFLTILGVGDNNLNDNLMQRLAQYGNGTAAYLDSLKEARKVLNDQVNKGMVPVANDVKLQIEFNPATVAEYRLIGYETRGLKREDFNNDKVDAGDVGAGQEVTAIYEITPTDSKARQVDPLRYETAKPAEPVKTASDEYAFLKLRYKRPGEATSQLINEPIGKKLEVKDVKELSNDIRFAGAVAGFGQLLRGSQQLQHFTYGDVLKLAKTALGQDPGGLRQEFLSLVQAAKTASELQGQPEPVILEEETSPVYER